MSEKLRIYTEAREALSAVDLDLDADVGLINDNSAGIQKKWTPRTILGSVLSVIRGLTVGNDGEVLGWQSGAVTNLPGAGLVKLSSTVVDTDVGTKQSLFTVPADKKCNPAMVVVHSATEDMSAIGDALLFGFDAGASDFGSISGTILMQLVDDTLATGRSNFEVTAPTVQKIGTAGDVFGCIFNDTSITDGELTIDTFGYLFDA